MASKRRLRRKSCIGKRKYINIKEAYYYMYETLKSKERKAGEKLDVYKCKFCKKYHIGHRMKKAHVFFNNA